MSTTDPHTIDPAQSHPSENGGHEMSDFTWTTVMWLIPLSVVVLIGFVLLCLYWFRGAKDSELAEKQSMVDITQLQTLRAKENEILSSYKWLDKDKGRVQIPIERAMELVVKEREGQGGLPYKPITDVYLQGAAFATEMAPAPAAPAPEKKAETVHKKKSH